MPMESKSTNDGQASPAFGQKRSNPSSNTYVPLEVIGQGSFGVVLHAKVQETGEDVAIKRVLFDRRFHNRELLLMRDIIGDARLPSGVSDPDNPTTAGALGSTEEMPQSPLSSLSKSSNGSFQSFSQNAQKARGTPVVLLRKHPNIVQLRSYYFSTDLDSGDGFLHLVMSYLPTDAQALKRHYFSDLTHQQALLDENLECSAGNESVTAHEDPKRALFPLQFTKVLLFQLCRALAFLHARNVCHRDVKPANILVDPQTGRLQLCDFGSAKQIHDRNKEKNVSYICSRYYRAPELLFGALHYGSEVDMWSVGCIAAEFLRSAGTPLFKGCTTVDQMAEIFKVLGAPSDVEMRAMNPQCALAMEFTHREQYPHSGHSFQTQDTEVDESGAPESTADSCDELRKNNADGNARAQSSGHAHSQAVATTARLGSDYYECYDVLRVKAMQWHRVLHRDSTDTAVDFVSKLLCYIPEKRLTAAAALEHPFFNDLFSFRPTRTVGGQENEEGEDDTAVLLPRLPNGKTLPVEMFMLTELETQIYSREFQQRVNQEVQRISSATAAAAAPSRSNSLRSSLVDV